MGIHESGRARRAPDRKSRLGEADSQGLRRRPARLPKYGAQMRLIALIEDPAVIERILSSLGLWHPLRACGPSPPAEHASLPLAYHPVPDIA
jgi:hypothetical protein